MDYEAAYKIEHKAVDDIWKLVDPWATKDIDITVRTSSIVEMVAKLKDENDRLRDRLKAADEEIKELRHQGGEDWALMAADVR